MARKRKKTKSKDKAKNKVVIRRLPPSLTEEQILVEIEQFKDEVDWHRFVPASHRCVIVRDCVCVGM